MYFLSFAYGDEPYAYNQEALTWLVLSGLGLIITAAGMLSVGEVFARKYLEGKETITMQDIRNARNRVMGIGAGNGD